jgi:hypothetical protein
VRALARSTTAQAAAALALILLVAAVLRLDGLDWDAGHHFHPDERYYSTVANDIHGPGSVSGYFDVEHSTLSPYNTESGRALVYGQLPLLSTKAVAAVVGRDSYDELYLVGRFLSALADLGSIVLVFLIGRLLFAGLARRTALAGSLLAAALYALTVSAIQQAHFFTVESDLVFFTLLAFWLAAVAVSRVELTDGRRRLLMLALGAATGLAVACKVSGVLLAIPVVIALAARAVAVPAASGRVRAARTAADALLVAAGTYVAFRLASPYAFEHSSWLNLAINQDFRRALEEQRRITDGGVLFPPTWQWLLSGRVVGNARDLLGWDLGPLLGLTAVAGVGLMLVALVRARRRVREGAADGPLVIAAMLVVFALASFAYFSTRFAHYPRYLAPIAPLLCLAGAYAVVALARRPVLTRTAAVVVLGTTLLWALAFTHVYRAQNTRVAATVWLNDTAPAGSTIVTEHWDDALPAGYEPDRYHLRELPVFEPDDDRKLRRLYVVLRDADLYVLSSPRAWHTIGRLPDRYPLMVRFYRELRGGRLGFSRVAQFRSEPELLGVTIDDLSADESFSVYDHPRVEVYRANGPLTWERFRTAVCGGQALPGCLP